MKRFALVIGNDTYQYLTPLEKAASDARAVGKALELAHFETRVVLNASRAQMNKAINQFADDVKGGGIGVFFFAGHGVQVNNQNFLIPIDVQDIQREADIADQGISLQVMQDKLAEVRSKFSLLVIDACRDNPLPKKAGRALGGTRGLSQGSSAEGQIVVFSAGANQQALDKLSDSDTNPNGVFTRELLPWLKKPGVSIRDAMLELRSNVKRSASSVSHEQFPAIYDQAEGNFYFIEGNSSKGNSPNPHSSGPRSADQIEDEFWDDVKGSDLASGLEEYIKKYPKGRYITQARVKLAALKDAAKSTTVPKTEISAPPGTTSDGVPFVLAKGVSTEKLMPVGTYSLKAETTPFGVSSGVVGLANAFVDCGLASISIHVEDEDGLNLASGTAVTKLTAGKKLRLSFSLTSSVAKAEFRQVVFDKIECLNGVEDVRAAAQPKAKEEFTRGPQWAESDNGADVNWTEAKNYCAGKGRNWRLPTVAELQSSYKAGTSTPCGSTMCIVASKSSLTGSTFWSSEIEKFVSPELSLVTSVNIGQFGSGNSMGTISNMRYNLRALCVRDRP